MLTVARRAIIREDTCPMSLRMTKARQHRKLSLREVSQNVGTDPTNLLRVERGSQVPKAPLARALHAFYGGRVPLAHIYDPVFSAELEQRRAAAPKKTDE